MINKKNITEIFIMLVTIVLLTILLPVWGVMYGFLWYVSSPLMMLLPAVFLTYHKKDSLYVQYILPNSTKILLFCIILDIISYFTLTLDDVFFAQPEYVHSFGFSYSGLTIRYSAFYFVYLFDIFLRKIK